MVSPYYQDKWVTICHGDCLESGETLCGYYGEVDLAIADFPFRHDKTLANFVASASMGLLVEGGNLLIIDNPHNLFRYANAFNEFTLRNEISLIRNREFCPAWHLGFKHNNALLLCKDDVKTLWNGNTINHRHTFPDVMEDCHKPYKGHPEAIGIEWAKMMIILLSRENSIVVDWFAGSGTFAEACSLLKRRYIGIEIEEKYCEIAAKRCCQEVMELVANGV
jgi:DNA modification methylase